MTSFEQPDASLLVEHLLPSLLGASHSLSQDNQERTLFFGELGAALEVLHGRITMISSPPRADRTASQYPWLWRYVSHFIVGADSRAVQHAKLWAFHWKVEDQEHLELHFSSVNLTTSAFKTQLQAGWRAMLPLSKAASQGRRETWGALVSFLDALGRSAGDVATIRMQRLSALLGRVECPPNITFVASIPGGKSAARQLKRFGLSALHVMTPTIGVWNDYTLAKWAADAGVALSRIHLKWISEQHPWAETAGWALTTAAHKALERNGVRMESLPVGLTFVEEHSEADSRWSHAKLYLLRSGKRRRLLVTSANWSSAAWGAGRKAPRNFEIGVVFDTEWTELEALGEPFAPPDNAPFCVEHIDEDDIDSALAWAEANWDGKRILLRARSSNLNTPVTARVAFADNSNSDVSLVDGAAAIPWKDPLHTPLTARFVQGTESLEVDVLDLRAPNAFSETPLPEVDPAVAKTLREAFLLQRYGGAVVDPETIPGLGRGRRPPPGGAPAGDYSVQAWIDARAAFNVVDNWRVALSEAANDLLLRERVRLDGEELRAFYARSRDLGAKLVAEELGWRLNEKP